MNAPRLRRLAVVLSVSLIVGGIQRPAADAKDFREAKKSASKLMKTPGQGAEKERTVETLGVIGSVDSAKLLIKWFEHAATWLEKELIPEAQEANERLEKTERILRKGGGKVPPRDAKAHQGWKALKDNRDKTKNHVEVEQLVQQRICSAIASIENLDTATMLAHDVFPKLQKKKRHPDLHLAITRCMVAQEGESLRKSILAAGSAHSQPKSRVTVFNYFANNKIDEGFECVVKGLKGDHIVVRRGAIYALRTWNDWRAVKPMIDALGKAKGLEAQELEEVLHWFTGQSFNAVTSVWKRWWKENGEAAMAAKSDERHPPQERQHVGTGTRATFYDIPTESKAIVFVLDRSGSMKEPAGSDSAKEVEKKKRRGPATGPHKGKDKNGGAEETIAGKTRLEVAQNKLAKSIQNLPKAVRFGLVFYSTDVKTWKAAPELCHAEPDTKRAATEWFMKLDAKGSTSLFPALMKALEYANTPEPKKKRKKDDTLGGANTIFLLSDGSPTLPTGKMTADQIEAQFQAFVKANEIYRCVVHTIGVGPSHRRDLMERIARATGGKYRAVGMN